MAFTEEQKVDIRFFLGYPDIYRYANPRLESAIQVVGGRPESQKKVEVLLERLNAIYGVDPGDPGQIDKVLQILGITKVESADDLVEYGNSSKDSSGQFTSSIQNNISDYGRMLVGALSSFFGVSIGSNVFGMRGYVGDSWSKTNGMSNGFGFSLI